ncbi:MAG: hypothetical protein PHW60_10340 [Kiritimatiellae bacterium]|nr:hypothetical protein [Kiritimatiellia bacterium]
MKLENVTLEMSLKPFWNPSRENCLQICRELFRQWEPLCRHANKVSVQLWIGDGSEILDYRGIPEDKFEWARYIGCVNRQPSKERLKLDPECQQLHTKSRLYRDNPPEFDYRFLNDLVAIIKNAGRERLGKAILVGGTFDPGPEFAKSSFKYERHAEICSASFGDSKKTDVVSCSATLTGDTFHYAGFPDGIPAGTPFGFFLGRQTRHFLAGMGMNFIWFSNGFGFGNCPWGYDGLLFDGKTYTPEQADMVKKQMLDFWRMFKAECPDYPVYVRGTNMTTGIDLASDGVPLKQIYAGGFIQQPPVNSPWAALNLNLGLELAGWMSHIAELPGKSFAFRFYTHDPWWINSPWLDRYERQPYDIYLPLAVSRIAADGAVQTASSVNFLSIDDSLGNMPEQVPNEVTPRLLECLNSAPDEAGPLVWVYPFDEYHAWIKPETGRIGEVMFGDLLVMDAINRGLPLNTVVSTASFVANKRRNAGFLDGRVIVSPVPNAGSEWEGALFRHVEAGGKALVYGPLRNAGDRFREALGVKLAKPLDGSMRLNLDAALTGLVENFASKWNFEHQSIISGGGLEETGGKHVLASAGKDGEKRSYAIEVSLGQGRLVWLRGTPSKFSALNFPEHIAERLNLPMETELFYPERLFSVLLDRCGWRFAFHRGDATAHEPVVAVSRHRNGFYYTGTNHHTLVEHELRAPFGAPVMNGYEAQLKDGSAFYRWPRTWRHECRVFVKQNKQSVISCREHCSHLHGITRWITITGLEDAELAIFPEPGAENRLTVLPNPRTPYVNGAFARTCPDGKDGWKFFRTVDKLSGKVLIYW